MLESEQEVENNGRLDYWFRVAVGLIRMGVADASILYKFWERIRSVAMATNQTNMSLAAARNVQLPFYGPSDPVAVSVPAYSGKSVLLK